MTKINLNLLLASRNLSQQEFARITKINKGTINRYCNNNCEKITLEHIDIICNYFNCTPNDLFTIIPKNKTIFTGDEALEVVREMSSVYGYNVNATKDDESKHHYVHPKSNPKLYNRIDIFLNDLIYYVSTNKKDLSKSEIDFLSSYDKYNSVSDMEIRVGIKLEKFYDYLRIILTDKISKYTGIFTNDYNYTLVILGTLTEIRNLHYHGGLTIYQDENTILELQDLLEDYHKKFTKNEIHFLD